MIGLCLQRRWARSGHEVVRLVRRRAIEEGEVEWDPSKGYLDCPCLAGTDVLVNLAGENIGSGRWTAALKHRIRASRVLSTELLAKTIADGAMRPRVWINASATGYYGDTGEAEADESRPVGRGFLAEVCCDWETATAPAAATGVRIVVMRLGMVLDSGGGALARMLPVFRAGLGGPLGDGRQWMDWVELDEVGSMVDFLIENDGLAGPVNAVAPEPVRNADFGEALGRVVRRPAILRTPAWALRLAFGEMGDELLLASRRTVPRELVRAGFKFGSGGLEGALRRVVTG
jgi:uncharacterized protein (TIGR01777 family)